jgi:hypothetical protein
MRVTNVTHVAIVTASLLSSDVIDEARGANAEGAIHMLMRERKDRYVHPPDQTLRKDDETKRKKEKRKRGKAIGVSRKCCLSIKRRHIGRASQANARPT